MADVLVNHAYKAQSKREKNELLRSQLEIERSSFLQHWRDLGDFILPRRPRFMITDTNRGDRRNQKIIDSTATLAARTLRSGMMGGVTSPARPWFRLTTPDPDMAEFGPVKEWLHEVSQRMSTAFLRSNLYNALPIVYGDIGVFATGSMFIEEDLEDVLRCYPMPIGSYMIANDEKNKVAVFFREFRYTVRQLVRKFGVMKPNGQPDWSKFSEHVKNAWDNGHYETWIDVCHVVQPNDEFDPTKLSSRYKRFSSCYYEKGFMGDNKPYLTGADDDRYLRESGYDYFPSLSPRWEVTGEDAYGTECPGMIALGDIKALQTMHKRKAQAIEKLVNPPLAGPPELRTTKVSLLPGDITYAAERDGQKGLRPIHEVDPRIGELVEDIREHQMRIQRSFYEDLFLMLAQSDRREITAREVEERHEEKLLALGPVLEQLNQDLLDPLIDLTFNFLERQGLIPEPPEELEGVKLKVEYQSVMAQAQKLVGIAGHERFLGFVGNTIKTTGDNSIGDKVDFDQFIDRYADRLGIEPDIVRTDEKVAEIRAERQKAAQASQVAETLPPMAKTAKDLSETSMEGDTALNRLMAAAQAGAPVQQ